MKDKSEKKGWQDIFKGSGNPLGSKKLLLLLLVGLIALFLLRLDGFTNEDDGERESHVDKQAVLSIGGDVESQMARSLEGILSGVEGVGQIKVLLTLKGGPQYAYANNIDRTKKETMETDTAGGTREITERTDKEQLVLSRSQNGVEEPILLKELSPEIKGVVVVAEGAGNPHIKEGLTRAVQTVLGISAHRVTVLPMGQ